jgi:TolB protein
MVPFQHCCPAILFFALIAFVVAQANLASAQQSGNAIGLFESHDDVGDTPRPGSASYDAATGEYRVTGGGANLWGPVDAFQFVWKQATGNFRLTADVRFIGAGKEAHRKALLMVRQTLNAGSAYADVALHGDGLTSLQFRPISGAETSEVRSSVQGPTRIQIERHGAQFLMYVGKDGGEPVGATPVTVNFNGPVYIGLGVCSHDTQTLETAVFSNVRIEPLPASSPEPNPEKVRSRISIYDLESKTVRVLYSADTLWEAPNWSPDGKYLIANSGGQIYRFPLEAKAPAQPEKLALDSSYRCNNDKSLSPDGKELAFSADHPPARGSQVFVASADGSNPRLLTPNTPSYFHGWSPDGKWLAFVAERDANFDIYRVSVKGGAEERLTSSPGFDDGPDYSPDGKWIYINSDRAGGWDIWRFPEAGAGPDDERAEQVTGDAQEDWFPHPSPDGKWLLILSFPPGTRGHDFKTAVKLRIMPMPTKGARAEVPKEDSPNAIRELTQFFGGQGTINVNSWSPDSTKFAFVSYELLP